MSKNHLSPKTVHDFLLVLHPGHDFPAHETQNNQLLIDLILIKLAYQKKEITRLTKLLHQQ